jgi:CLIP-associating protein 1/2
MPGVASLLIIPFRAAPGHAKADLKKQLTQRNVRKTIATYIITHLELSPPLDMDLKASVQSVQSVQSLDYQENVPRKEAYPPAESYQPSSSTNQPPPSEHDVDQLEPAYVDTQRVLLREERASKIG